MKFLKSRYFLIMLCLTLFGCNFLASGQAIAADGDPDRVMNTTLNYAFPNSTLFIFKTDLLLSTYVIAEGNVIVNETISGSQYRLEQVIVERFSNTSANLTINTYDNATDDISLNLNRWTFGYNSTSPVNNTLAGVINVGNYYPQDVFVKDVFQKDDSFAEAFIRFIISNNIPFETAFLFYEYIRSFRDTSNVTINSETNNTETQILSNYDGVYNWSYNSSALLNDLTIYMSPPYQDWTLNQTIDLDLNVSQNCYHVFDLTELSLSLDLYLVNNTNSSQNMQLIYFAHTHSTLIDSTLMPCLLGFENLEPEQEIIAQNWIWILVAIIGSVIGTIVISLLIQRSRCDTFKKPLEHLACRIGNKYKK